MSIEHLDIYSEHFDDIVEDIKQRNLSRNNMPKIIVGTGLSLVYGVPGMKELAVHLSKKFEQSSNEYLKQLWEKYSEKIKVNGLEAGLANVTENELVEAIKPITAQFILENEEKLHETIYRNNTGFYKLLQYLKGTVSVDKRIIDIMTPNYDRIIEIVCDRLGIGVITGFDGSLYGQFNRNLLKKPAEIYNCRNHVWVRLYKPHGSINWINNSGKEYLTNDYQILKNNAEHIEIVAPGSSKYKVGMINNTFRCMREEFNELLDPRDSYSLFIYGYGFNDAHFDTALFDSFQKNVLILARDVKLDITKKAMETKNITIYYHENDKEYMIYRSQKYEIDLPVWDINTFADIFIG